MIVSVASIESLMAALGPDDAGDTFNRASLNFDELVTLEQAARRLGKPESTLRRWLSDGRFTVVGRVGRLSYVSWGAVVDAEFEIRKPKRRGARPPKT